MDIPNNIFQRNKVDLTDLSISQARFQGAVYHPKIRHEYLILCRFFLSRLHARRRIKIIRTISKMLYYKGT